MYNNTNPAKQVYKTADMLLTILGSNKMQKPENKSKGLLAKNNYMRAMSAPKQEQPMDIALQYAKIFREKRESLDIESSS